MSRKHLHRFVLMRISSRFRIKEKWQTGKMANDSDNSSSQVKISTVDVEKLSQETRDHVKFKGTVINSCPNNKTIKTCNWINLAKFRDSQPFQDHSVRYTTAELSAPIKIVEHVKLNEEFEFNSPNELNSWNSKEWISWHWSNTNLVCRPAANEQ
jgi:hypothetical protein